MRGLYQIALKVGDFKLKITVEIEFVDPAVYH